MEKNTMTNRESLELIEQMISRAKDEEKDSGLGWILWGFLLFFASIIHYILLLARVNNSGMVWNVFGVASLLLVSYSIYRDRLGKSGGPVKTYTAELISKIGIGFFISLAVLVIGNITSHLNRSGVNFGYLLLLYAFWLYIHGSAFRFRPIIYGAFINWAGAIVIFIWYEELGKHILLIHAICVLLGYIIPGFMARKNFSHKADVAENRLP